MKRKALLVLLALVLLGITVFGSYVFFYQPKEKIIDETEENYTENVNVGDGDDKEEYMLFNPNVNIYMGEMATVINNRIAGIDYDGISLTIRFPADEEEEFMLLQAGELFFLEGDSTTPLGETYIGRIVENRIIDNERRITVEQPMIDEVFDEFYLNDKFEITEQTINSISTIEGVDITPVSKLEADFLCDSVESNSAIVENLVWKNDKSIDAINTAENSSSFIIELDVDLDKALGISKEKEQSEDNKETIKSNTGNKLTGKIGVEDISIYLEADWNKASYGMRNLAIGVNGKQIVKAGLEFQYEGEISGKTTEQKLGNILKVQGLKEKVFPIAYFDCTTGKPMKIKGVGNSLNENIENTYEVTPFACGIMLYLDIYGNISYEAVLDYEYTDEFDNKLVLVKDNQNVCGFEGESDPKQNFSAELKVAADGDVHIGVSAMAYCFNLNIVDIALVKLGAEAEGNGTFRVSTDEEADVGFYGSFYARIYAKIIDAKACLKMQINLWNIANLTGNIGFEKTLLDLTLSQTGEKNSTHYNKDTMKWEKMTAEDESAFYYKSLDGTLFKEMKNGIAREEIYNKDFFSICGVDQSYVYVLEASEDEQYDLRRINKEGNTTKVILKDVKYVLLMKDDYIYYVPSFSSNEIYRFNRNDLKQEQFMRFEENVEYMTEETVNNFFVVTEEEDAFSWLFGAESTYYRVSMEGNIIEKYDSNIQPQDCMKEEMPLYTAGYKLITNGYLRVTAEAVYWLDRNNNYVETKGTAGWNPKECGILVTQEREDGMYDVVLYRAIDGKEQYVASVNSKYTFFTFIQGEKGEWYFMDQKDNVLELYKMDENFNGKELVEEISSEKAACNMEECSMEIVNNRLFFFEMPSWSESKVLYRYSVY